MKFSGRTRLKESDLQLLMWANLGLAVAWLIFMFVTKHFDGRSIFICAAYTTLASVCVLLYVRGRNARRRLSNKSDKRQVSRSASALER
jgi:hypothetical protein